MPFVKKIFRAREKKSAQKILCDLGFTLKNSQKMLDLGRVSGKNGKIFAKTDEIFGDFLIKIFIPAPFFAKEFCALHNFTNFCQIEFSHEILTMDFKNFSLDPKKLRENTRPAHLLHGFLQPIFENENFAVFNKPPRLLSHPKGHFWHFSVLDSARGLFGDEANLAHRLDFETSGLLICGKNKKFEAALKTAIQNAQKTYFAWVKDEILHEKIIDFALLPPKKYEKFQDLGIKTKISGNGKRAVTEISPLKIVKSGNETHTLLKISPKTGRTHQIRAHLAHAGHKILGENLYGDEVTARTYLAQGLAQRTKNSEFLALLAGEISFDFLNERYSFAL